MNVKKVTKSFKYKRFGETLQENRFRNSKQNKRKPTWKCNSITEILKNKIAAVKPLDDEIEEVEDNPHRIGKIVNDRSIFEIYCKAVCVFLPANHNDLIWLGVKVDQGLPCVRHRISRSSDKPL